VADIDPSAEPGDGGQEAGVLPDPKLAALCTPFSDTDLCGPDLDMEGDADYLNFFASVEGVLPTTFFSVEDGSPFDRSTVDIKGQLDALAPLLQRTRDIRLLLVQARLLILNKDLGGFALNLAAVAYWLDKFWDAVHPRPQPGDAARSGAISTLDLPTVIFPLQYAPLIEARRLGPISYRTWMIATGEVIPARAAMECGMVNRVFPDQSFAADAEQYALKLASKPPGAMMLSKQLLYRIDGISFDAAIQAGVDTNAMARMTGELKQGVDWFQEITISEPGTPPLPRTSLAAYAPAAIRRGRSAFRWSIFVRPPGPRSRPP